MNSDYLYEGFTRLIDKRSIHTIIECGSRDGLDTIALEEFFNPDVIYSFECNPESIPVCLGNIEGHEKILFSNMAVTNIDGRVKFYPTDMRKSPDKNIGASSLFRHTRGLVQKEIEVEAVRLDTFMQLQNINHIDLLCMDLQGAEPLAIEGLGERIKDVAYIITEVCDKIFYEGEVPFQQFNDTLEKLGFECLCKKGINALYKHR
jgi:FkbM family methyltransferase